MTTEQVNDRLRHSGALWRIQAKQKC